MKLNEWMITGSSSSWKIFSHFSETCILREKSGDEEVVTANKAKCQRSHSIIADRLCHLHGVEQVTIVPIFFWQRFRNAFMIVSHIWSAQSISGCSPRAKVRCFNSVCMCFNTVLHAATWTYIRCAPNMHMSRISEVGLSLRRAWHYPATNPNV